MNDDEALRAMLASIKTCPMTSELRAEQVAALPSSIEEARRIAELFGNGFVLKDRE